MTAAAINFFADKVSICSDSRVYDDLGATAGYAAKTYAIQHARALVFGRGKLSITTTTVAKLLLSPQLHTFDDIAAAFSDLYRDVTESWCEQFAFDRTKQPLHEFALAGFSESEQRMRLGFASSLGEFTLHWQEAFGGPIAWPRVPASYIPAAKSTDTADDRLRDTMLGIDRWCVANPTEAGGVRLGGDMLLAELSETSISYRVIGSFEDGPAKPESKRKDQRAARKRGRR